MPTKDAELRRQVVKLLDGGQAHVDFEAVVRGVPEELRGRRPPGVEHSLWELLEHLRIGQWDILEFCRDPRHVSPRWPEGYWPQTQEPPDARAWAAAVESFQADLEAMKELVESGETDLFTPLAHGQGQTILREALLVADHNSYHLGQMVLLRRLLGIWPASG